jgi:hypothetical protein
MTPYFFEKKNADFKEKGKASTFKLEESSTLKKEAQRDSDTPINLTVFCSSFSNNTVFEL